MLAAAATDDETPTAAENSRVRGYRSTKRRRPLKIPASAATGRRNADGR